MVTRLFEHEDGTPTKLFAGKHGLVVKIVLFPVTLVAFTLCIVSLIVTCVVCILTKQKLPDQDLIKSEWT